MFLGDPMRQDECAGRHKKLADATSTPIGTGESLYTVCDFRNYLKIGALDVVLPDICHTRILRGKKIAALAEAYHLPVPHNPNSPLSTIISGHFYTCIPSVLALEIFPSEREVPWADRVVTPPLTSLVNEGHLTLPAGPGSGVEVNDEELLKCPYQESWYSRVVGSRGSVG